MSSVASICAGSVPVPFVMAGSFATNTAFALLASDGLVHHDQLEAGDRDVRGTGRPSGTQQDHRDDEQPRQTTHQDSPHGRRAEWVTRQPHLLAHQPSAPRGVQGCVSYGAKAASGVKDQSTAPSCPDCRSVVRCVSCGVAASARFTLDSQPRAPLRPPPPTVARRGTGAPASRNSTARPPAPVPRLRTTTPAARTALSSRATSTCTRGRPSRFPSAFARRSPARTRSAIRDRSSCAIAAMIVMLAIYRYHPMFQGANFEWWYPELGDDGKFQRAGFRAVVARRRRRHAYRQRHGAHRHERAQPGAHDRADR